MNTPASNLRGLKMLHIKSFCCALKMINKLLDPLIFFNPRRLYFLAHYKDEERILLFIKIFVN